VQGKAADHIKRVMLRDVGNHCHCLIYSAAEAFDGKELTLPVAKDSLQVDFFDLLVAAGKQLPHLERLFFSLLPLNQEPALLEHVKVVLETLFGNAKLAMIVCELPDSVEPFLHALLGLSSVLCFGKLCMGACEF
jgi:hypothetical protein